MSGGGNSAENGTTAAKMMDDAMVRSDATSHKVERVTDPVTKARSGIEAGASAEGIRQMFVTPANGAVAVTNGGRQALPLRRIILQKPSPLLAASFPYDRGRAAGGSVCGGRGQRRSPERAPPQADEETEFDG
ncbi:hypothetical protein PIB30_033950 [Stylosanthes scabra]|uniref:SMP domain-containing protein n=1 Tax=Stylosanthes scabra TaxID=79078 RepID=A0ABU6QCR6_9FABA|nr:hypothetical protein [Stylosanthes scabra]